MATNKEPSKPDPEQKPRTGTGQGCCTDSPADASNYTYQTNAQGEMYAVERTRVSDALVIKGSGGEIYFIRKELLEATRVTEPEMKKLLEGEVKQHYSESPERFNVHVGPIEKIVPLRGPFDPMAFDVHAAGTIMCAGNCRKVAYIVPDDEF